MKFTDLSLAEPILRAVAEENYVTATPVQAAAIPHILAGRDVLGSAQTGTGKTAAFALPILHQLSISRREHAGTAPRCLVLCPTRELAMQIADSFRIYGKHTGLKSAAVFGGANIGPQAALLRRGVDILIATPGRLLDLVSQRMVDLRQIQILVLDEADRMLDMGFIHDIRRIVGLLPPKRQNLLFSATMPPEIRRLADTILHGPAVVQVATTSAVADRIDQSIYFVHREGKPALLAHLFNELPIARAIVFTRTKHGADRLVRRLHTAGIRSEAIHGNKSQNARQKALANFRTGKTPLLIATDVASRGIDVDGITHVVNYDLTAEPETYVHRIGRTARAGASGSAISFCNEDERGNLKAIERLIRRSIPVKQATAVAALPLPQESVAQHQHTAPKAEMQSAASAGRAPREGGRFQHRQKTWKGRHPKRGASGHHAKARSFR